MSADVNVESIARAEVQEVLNLFDRLSDDDKRDLLARLTRRDPTSSDARPSADEEARSDTSGDLDWDDLSEEDHDRLAAEAFADLDREEELARGDRRRPG